MSSSSLMFYSNKYFNDSDDITGRLALVFELMDQNLYEAIKGKRQPLPEKKVKTHMYQLLKSLDFMHRNGIFHRDIKPYFFLNYSTVKIYLLRMII